METTIGTEHLLLNESPTKLFFHLSVPAVVGMLIFGLYQFIDGVFVGQFIGPEGMGAIGLVYPVSLMNNAISGLIGTGASSIVARSLGKGDRKTASEILPSVFYLNLVFSGLFTVGAIIFSPQILIFMGGKGDMLELGVTYMRILLTGTFFINFAASANMLIRSEGRMKEAMAFLISGALLNLVLDPIFMLVLDMGIGGAAAATVISQILSLVLSLAYFVKGRSQIRLLFSPSMLQRKRTGEILKVGFSALALPAMAMIEIITGYRMLELYGTLGDVVALGSIFKIFSLILPPVWGIAQGMQPFIGMNFGAGNIKRLLRGFRVFTLYATVFTTTIWLPIAFAPETVLSLFITDEAMRASVYNAPRIFFLFYPLYGFLFNTLVMLQACGDAKKSSIFVLCRMLLFFVPPMLIICPVFGGMGVWTANPISDVLTSILTGAALFAYIGKLKRDPEYG